MALFLSQKFKYKNNQKVNLLDTIHLLKNDLVKSIGETGLDFNRNFSSPEDQQKSFEAHLELSIELNKPLFLHERDAHEKFVDIIFSIITPETSQSEHLLILSAISNFLKKKGCIEKLRKLDSAEEIYKLFGLA